MLSISRSIVLLMIMSFSLVSFGQFSVIQPKKIDKESLEKATVLADKLMKGMKDGSYLILSEDDATPAMVMGLTEDTQKDVYSRVSETNGDYEGLKFVAALKPDNDNNLTIFRFRGSFENEKKGPEIRVVMNKDQKLAGFWILPWKDDVSIP